VYRRKILVTFGGHNKLGQGNLISLGSQIFCGTCRGLPSTVICRFVLIIVIVAICICKQNRTGLVTGWCQVSNMDSICVGPRPAP
jgi:hypothetical protein